MQFTYIHKGFRLKCGPWKSSIEGNGLFVTDRNVVEYDPEIVKALPLNPKLQYMETGAGLGEIVPFLATNLELEKPIIVIDPLDYTIVKELLERAYDINYDPFISNRLKELIRRCEIILDPNKVKLVNKRLEDVLDSGELDGIADVLIDHCGGVLYSEDIDRVRENIHRLITPSGKLLMIPQVYDPRYLNSFKLWFSSSGIT